MIDKELEEAIRRIVQEELEAQNEGKQQCAWCEGMFPESAMNWQSGDPACASCQKAFQPQPFARRSIR